MEKYPETSKRVLKAYIQGINLAKFNKKEAIKAGYEAGLQGDPEIVNAAWNLYSPGLTADLSIAPAGLQQMLDEDIRNGVGDINFTLDRVVNDRILKITQQELRAEGKIRMRKEATNTVGEDSPAITLRQISAARTRTEGESEIGFRVTNESGDVLELISARLPHGQFRGDTQGFAATKRLAPRASFTFTATVRCHEPPGLVTENAFVIFLVRWQGTEWRMFARVRVTVDASGTPQAFIESITTQQVGFSGVND